MYNFPQEFSPVQSQGKGKGKSRQEDFEAAFAQFASSVPAEKARIVEVGDGIEELENAMRSAGIDESQQEDSSAAEYGTNFQKYALRYFLCLLIFLY